MRTIPINQTPDAGDSATRYGLTRQNTPKESISTIYHCYRTNPRTSHGPSFPGDHCGSSSVRCPQGASTLILATILAYCSLIPPLPAPCRWGPAQATERNQFSCNHSRPESTLAGARTIAVQPHPSEDRWSSRLQLQHRAVPFPSRPVHEPAIRRERQVTQDHCGGATHTCGRA